jgi:nucleotide-binding universal stress UspA family protein
MADALVRESPGEAGEKGLRSGALGILGSTPYKLLHLSPVPMLVVRVPDQA